MNSRHHLPQANKDLGQHFLRDQGVIQKITDDFSDQAEAIIEVGPGPGILTGALASHKLPYYVIEMDKRFEEFLTPHLSHSQITFGDALQINWREFLAEKGLLDKKIWMVSNLPYNISVPLTVSFLQVPEIKFMSLMYQKEVAEKIISFDHHKKNGMGSLMALCQNFFKCRLLCKVPPGAFSPPPKVDSAVVSFERLTHSSIPMAEFAGFEKFLRQIFAHKRKQLGSVLKVHYSSELWQAALDKVGIDRTIRAEAFSFEQVIELYQAFISLKKD